MAVAAYVGAAYAATAGAWQSGPGRIYDRLADVVVAHARASVHGRTILDLGSGTGAASRAIAKAGGRPIGLDLAHPILAWRRDERPPAVAGDALALPLLSGSVGGVVAAFSLNHVDDPVGALVEIRRVCASGPIVVTAYAANDGHPVKDVVEHVLRARGWSPAAWYTAFRRDVVPMLATPDRAGEAAAAAGLDARAEVIDVAFPELAPPDLVAWRMGMAQHAPFVATLDPETRAEVADEAEAALGTNPPVLVRSIVILTASV